MTSDMQVFALSSIDILKKLKEKYPNEEVTFIGSQNVCIEYIKKKKPVKIFDFMKVLLIGTVIFFGSGTALMAFQIESNIDSLVFEYSKIFGITEKLSKYAFAFSYSIGITLGIILFFNRFGNKKITKDPTPIELEMNEFNNKIKENITQSFLYNKEEKDE